MIQHIWLFPIFLVVTAALHALLEIQIEGAHGWAEKLPTKKLRHPLLSRISEHSYITGFHLATVMFVLVISHFPLLFVFEWSVSLEAIIFGFVLIHFTLEDFLWFVFNPHFGLSRFNAKHIWWHRHWFLGFPLGYWTGFPAGIALVILAR